MQRQFNGYRVLVTAGASGIGLSIARHFAASGAKVHVCDVDQQALAELASISSDISGTFCDVSDRNAVAAMMNEAITKLGGLDVLVNNAGIAGPTGRVDEIPAEQWDRTFAVNITGQFNVTRLAVPELAKGEYSSIICLASAAGRLAFPNRSAYAASKWAVVGFTKTIAAELGPLGIRVNAVLPGLVDGPRLQGVLAAKALVAGVPVAEIEQLALGGVSIKSLVAPDDVAATVLFLASTAARSISGQALSVDNDTHYMV